jgi:hypothetical protein
VNHFLSISLQCLTSSVPPSGAWLALSLWEQFTFSFQINILEAHVLPAFRGIALFFLDHMVGCRMDAGRCRWLPISQHPSNTRAVFYTGPTTSPETSYQWKQSSSSTTSSGKKESKGISSVAMSPAIDCSVLRQV